MQTNPVVQHPFFGPAMPDLNWIPAPRYVLRRDRVLDLLKDVAPCRVLDIGCGPGALISELSARGFDAVGVDGSAKARALGRTLQAQLPALAIEPELSDKWKGSFDIVMSYEVIEHIDDDVGALRGWREYLKPGGRLMLSTPAHPGRWNAADEWAGHVRRYERGQLTEAVEAAGFKVDHVECYGFPLANIFEVARARAYGRKLAARKEELQTSHAMTEESGSDRSVDVKFWKAYASLPSAWAMKLFCKLQRPFLNTDLGNGYIVVATAP